MSYKFYDLVWAHKFDSPTEKIVMLELARYADENGKSWPKVKTIANSCGISPRTVQRQIKQFEQAGLLIIQKEYRADGGQTTNRYFITLPSVKTLVPSDSPVTGGATSTSPLPQTAACHTGDDTVVTSQELPIEPKEEKQLQPDTDLRYPSRLKASDRGWIIKLLQGVPKQDAQLLLDELGGALKAERIKGPSSRWFYGLLLNYKNGNFCPRKQPSEPILAPIATTIESNNEPSVRNKEARNHALESMKIFTASKLVR